MYVCIYVCLYNRTQVECSIGVTSEGLCECLQGSTAMACGVVVLTGTPEITSELLIDRLPALFRRINCRAELPRC